MFIVRYLALGRRTSLITAAAGGTVSRICMPSYFTPPSFVFRCALSTTPDSVTSGSGSFEKSSNSKKAATKKAAMRKATSKTGVQDENRLADEIVELKAVLNQLKYPKGPVAEHVPAQGINL